MIKKMKLKFFKTLLGNENICRMALHKRGKFGVI